MNPDHPTFQDEENPQFYWVWNEATGSYERTGTESKPKPYPHRIDNDMFNPATQLEQPKNPMFEGIMASMGDEANNPYHDTESYIDPQYLNEIIGQAMEPVKDNPNDADWDIHTDNAIYSIMRHLSGESDDPTTRDEILTQVIDGINKWKENHFNQKNLLQNANDPTGQLWPDTLPWGESEQNYYRTAAGDRFQVGERVHVYGDEDIANVGVVTTVEPTGYYVKLDDGEEVFADTEDVMPAYVNQAEVNQQLNMPEPCPNCLANALRPDATGGLECGICGHKFVEDETGRLQPAPGGVGGEQMFNPFQQDTPGQIDSLLTHAGWIPMEHGSPHGGPANTGDVVCPQCGKRIIGPVCANCGHQVNGTEQPVVAGPYDPERADMREAGLPIPSDQRCPGTWKQAIDEKNGIGACPECGHRTWVSGKNTKAPGTITPHRPAAKQSATQVCPECGAEGMREHRPDCSLGRLQHEFTHRPIENYKTEPFNDKVERSNPLRLDNSFPSMVGNISSEAPSLDECPNCQGKMSDRDGDRVCAKCGSKQPIMYAKESGFMDTLKTIAPLALAAIPGVGEVAAPLAMGAEAAGAAGAAGEAASVAPEVAGAAGLMNGAMNAGKGMANLMTQPGLAGGITRHEVFNTLDGSGGGNNNPGAQQQNAPQTTDIQSQLYSNYHQIPEDHIRFSYDVGPATPINGDDVNPEMYGQWGNQNRNGDSPELFKDQDGEAGGTDSLHGLEARFPLVNEFFESDRPGKGHPELEHLHKLLTETLPGYADTYNALEARRHSNMIPTQPQQQQFNNFNNNSPAQSITPGTCPICEQSGHDAAHCPQASAQPGSGMQGMNQGQQMMGNYISPTEKISARRPRMCPYHSDLTDYSLTLADPAGALGALRPDSYGSNWCKSGDYDSKCNFKPDMLKQEYWDAKELASQERAQERLVQMEQQTQLMTEPEVVEDTSIPAENIDMGGHSPDISGGASAIQEPVMANIKTAEDFRDYGDEHLPPDDMYSEPCPMCGAENAPMGQLGNRTHYRCRNCGTDYSDQDQQHLHNNFADPSGEPFRPYDDDAGRFAGAPNHKPDCGCKLCENMGGSQLTDSGPEVETEEKDEEENTKTAAGPHWFDVDGNPLVPGQTYEMMASNYAIPDKVTIENVDNPGKIGVVIEAAGRKLRQELTAQQLAQNKFEFKHTEHNMMQEPVLNEHTLEQNADSYTHGDPQEQDDLSSGAVSHEHEAEPVMEGNPSLDWLKDDGAQDLVAPHLVAKTAGKNFSPSEQKAFINENGSARNLDKLNLSGTHYDHYTNLDDHFGLGL